MSTRPTRATAAKKNYAEDDDNDDDAKVTTTTKKTIVASALLTKATKKKTTTTTRSKKEKKVVEMVEYATAAAAAFEEEEGVAKAPTAKATTTTTATTGDSTIANIIYSHFDTYQRYTGGSAYAAASSLHRDLLSTSSSSSVVGNEGYGGINATTINEEEVSDVIITCLDSTMSSILRLSPDTKGVGGGGGSKNKGNNECWMESTTSTLELIVAFAFLHNPSPTGAGGGLGTSSLPLAIIERATQYARLVDVDNGRIVACKLLKMMITQLLPTSTTATGTATKSKSALKKGGKKSKEDDNTNNFTNDDEVGKGGGEGAAKTASPWEIECLYRATVALVARITDKISRVRHAAIEACGPLLSLLVSTSPIGKKFFSNRTSSLETTVNVFAMTMNSLLQKLLWLARNDTSVSNRALIVCILPPSAIAIGCNDDNIDEEDVDNNNVAMNAIIERIKDVDVRVREAALDTIRMNVHDFVVELTEDMRVEILRMGLTKRCMTTYAKTVQLLCTNWLKLTRFDPIALLDHLNPVLNESICEEVSRVLIRIASMIDLEDGPSDRGVELVREHFGGPEIRSLIQIVLKRLNIVADSSEGVTANNGVVDENVVNGGLTPSMALFLRVRCEVSSSTDVVAGIITDVPTLCSQLNTHIDKLIDFNSDDEIYDEMDEDEAAAHEDAQAFVCLQLMHMARSSELHREEGSRRHFITIMRRIMARLATPDDLVEACVKAMASAHDKESQFLQTISEILADVEDDDTFQNKDLDPRALVIVRQMRIIAILSIVLESVSGNVTSHPILDTFFQHLSPAITSKNAIVREHGVICLSKFCLLSGEDKVLNEFRPLLLTIAGSVEERVEVRFQAALALCDLALIHERMLLVEEEKEEENTTAVVGNARNSSSSTMPSFKGMLLEMLGHSKPGIVIIAAEIAAKLLLARRITDPTIIAWLVLIYFDSSLMNQDDEYADNGSAEEAAKKVGSPVRLQQVSRSLFLRMYTTSLVRSTLFLTHILSFLSQLLSIFFPTYSMSSLDANDDMMSSIGPLLAILNQKLTGMKETDPKAKIFPIAKMVEYICYNVDLADKKKNEETKNESFGTMKCDETTTVIDSEQTVTNCNSTTEEDATVVIEASSILLAAIEVSEFLSEDCDTAPIFFTRALAKILASARIDVEAEDKALLRRLKSSVGEAEYANDDGPTVKSIKKLVSLLANVNDEEDDPSENVAGQVDKEENMSDNDHNDKTDDSISLRDIVSVVEKENHSLCGAVDEFDLAKVVEDEQRTSYSLRRVSLADVN